jgi:hypothetical protein
LSSTRAFTCSSTRTAALGSTRAAARAAALAHALAAARTAAGARTLGSTRATALGPTLATAWAVGIPRGLCEMDQAAIEDAWEACLQACAISTRLHDAKIDDRWRERG